ncbi:MAG: hypothetical protein U0441_34565 [Polyangiaceae bacterium]
MSASQKNSVADAELGADPVWAAFVQAYVDREPTPDHERRALSDSSTQVFIDGATITREIQARRR